MFIIPSNLAIGPKELFLIIKIWFQYSPPVFLNVFFSFEHKTEKQFKIMIFLPSRNNISVTVGGNFKMPF